MSWWQLLDVLKMADQEFEWWANTPPFACPKCGEPLRNAPPTDSGSDVQLYCLFDGWQYPRDYIRPIKR
jgi:hypothetical protein